MTVKHPKVVPYPRQEDNSRSGLSGLFDFGISKFELFSAVHIF